MQTINNYNIDNSYTDNSTTVNYYIGTVDSAGTVTNTYNPAVYDETTLIYTDPVTDTQYLTTGWTYDYTTRRYSLTMAEDAYTIGKTAVATIDLTYGDDGVTIAHYDSAGTLLQEDAYAYVVAAPIEPGSCDHEFLWTVTTPATCTAAGERTGTCSICGGVMRQAIPAAAHAYAYTTTAEATCTSAGERTGECAVCHATVTEAVPALGHDWRKVKDVDTVFNEDGTVQEYSHTLYECARCKEQAESYDGDAPPPAEDETPSDGFSLSSWLMDFRSWFESALSALADKLSGSSLDQDSSDVYDGLKSQDEAASDSSPGWSFFGFLSSAVQGGTKLIRTVSGFFSGLFSDLGESLDGFTNAYSTTDPDSAFALFTSFDEEVAPDVPAS